MTNAYVKAKLKESRDAIQRKQWDDAWQSASYILEEDPCNYNANVFLGLALLNLGKFDEAERAYQAAIASQPSQQLAYQGLEKFYTQRKDWNKLVSLLRTQADLALEAQDAVRCAENLQRIIQIEKERGTKSQKAEALALVLPGSRYYKLLETLPAPEPTKQQKQNIFEVQMAIHVDSLKITQEVVGHLEYLEKDVLDKEVDKKRMRIDGAGKSMETLRYEAGIAVWSHSSLPSLYEQVLSHTDASNEERRDAEGKLLRYHNRLLLALPPDPNTTAVSTGTAARASITVETASGIETIKKHHVRDKVLEMAKGMVVVGVPDELAWSVHLEWNDVRSLVDLPRHLLRQFVSLFPRSGRTQAFSALLSLFRDKHFAEEMEGLKKLSDVDYSLTDRDPLSMAIVAAESSPESVLSLRIAAKMYLLDRDYVSANDLAKSALARAKIVERDAGLTLRGTQTDLKAISGIALARIYGTQNHPKALRLLAEVLEDGEDIDALFGRGFIEAEAKRWDPARAFYQRIIGHPPDQDDERERIKRLLSLHKQPVTEAKGEVAWCDIQLGRVAEGKNSLDEIIEVFDADAINAPGMQCFTDEDRGRAWWRAGECLVKLATKGLADFAHAFDKYIASIKRFPSFAPAFNSLGIYYEQYQTPPDPMRSSKCFQKAFELDATQTHAAHKLASHYADEREWELVFMIARRVIEGEGGMAALASDQAPTAAQKHKSQNGWAWKAIGIVRLERGEAQEAISPFQVALRVKSDDAILWQRLGEAYALTGRLTAAFKAFQRALELGVTDSWQTRYSIAEILRRWEEYDEALVIFYTILDERTDDFSIRTTASETQLLKSRKEHGMGFVHRAQHSLELAVEQASKALEKQPLLRSAWKVVSDACLDMRKIFVNKMPPEATRGLLKDLVDLATSQDADAKLPSVSIINVDTVHETLESANHQSRIWILETCAYFNKLRILLCASDDNLIGTAWADLAIVLADMSKEPGRRDTNILIKQAITCVKEALNHEPANAAFWLLLGNLTFKTSLKVAQHAFIRSIENSLNDPVPWTNLGLLYLHHGDVELARESLVQAQTFDPEFPTAWLGLALLSCAQGDERSATAMFYQAVELSEGSLCEADYGLASSFFASSKVKPSDSARHTASFALSSLLSHEPMHSSALHLSALYAERLGEHVLAIERIERAAGILEQEFESSEDLRVALQFAVAQSNLSRIRLVAGDLQGAQNAAEVAIGLLEEENFEDALDKGKEQSQALLTGSQCLQARCNAQLVLALALAQSSQVQEAILILQSARRKLEDARMSRFGGLPKGLLARTITLQAQILFVNGKAKEAKETLLEALNPSGSAVSIIVTIGATALLEQDADLLDAALSELEGQTETDGMTDAYVTSLLKSMAAFMAGRDDEALGHIANELAGYERWQARAAGGNAFKVDRGLIFKRQIDYCEALLRSSLANMSLTGQAERARATQAKELCAALVRAAEDTGATAAVPADGEQKSRLLRLASVVALLTLSVSGRSSSSINGHSDGPEQPREDTADGIEARLKESVQTAQVDATVRSNQGLSFARRAVVEAPNDLLNWRLLDIVQGLNTPA